VDGEGRVSTRERKLNVTFPRGMHAGQVLRLAGQGSPGVGQGKPGDLYLEIGFNPHPRYRVEERSGDMIEFQTYYSVKLVVPGAMYVFKSAVA